MFGPTRFLFYFILLFSLLPLQSSVSPTNHALFLSFSLSLKNKKIMNAPWALSLSKTSNPFLGASKAGTARIKKQIQLFCPPYGEVACCSWLLDFFHNLPKYHLVLLHLEQILYGFRFILNPIIRHSFHISGSTRQQRNSCILIKFSE